MNVMLLGRPDDGCDFSRQKVMHIDILRRCADIVEDACPLIEQYVTKNGWDMAVPPVFLEECSLEHVLLPDMDAKDMLWDLTVLGRWPGFMQRSEEDDPASAQAMFMIEMNNWMPVAISLA